MKTPGVNHFYVMRVFDTEGQRTVDCLKFFYDEDTSDGHSVCGWVYVVDGGVYADAHEDMLVSDRASSFVTLSTQVCNKRVFLCHVREEVLCDVRKVLSSMVSQRGDDEEKR